MSKSSKNRPPQVSKVRPATDTAGDGDTNRVSCDLELLKLREENEKLQELLEQQQNENLSIRKNFDTLLILLKTETKRSTELLQKVEEENEQLRKENERHKLRSTRNQFVFGFVVLLMLGYIVKVI